MRFGILCLCGAFLLLFALPLIAVFIVKDLYVNDIYLQYNSNLITLAEAVNQTNSVTNLFNLLAIPCLSILSLAYAGISRILRQLAFGEGVFPRHDFSRGIKDNWANCLISFTLGAIVNFANYFVVSYVEKNDGSVFAKVFPLCISLIVLLPVALLILSQTCVYNAGFFEQCKNAFALYFKTLPTTLLAVIIFALPMLYLLINNLVARLLITIVLFVLILPLLILAWQLYCFFIFDKHINKRLYLEIVDKGVYRKN